MTRLEDLLGATKFDHCCNNNKNFWQFTDTIQHFLQVLLAVSDPDVQIMFANSINRDQHAQYWTKLACS